MVQIIMDCVTPNFICDVPCFFGFDNFYPQFIVDYSMIMAPFTQPLFGDLR